MKLTKYIWAGVKDVTSLLVLFGAFSVAQTKFETVVIAMLALIYLSVSAYFMAMGKLNFVFIDFFIKGEQSMRKLLKQELDEYEKETENEDVKKYNQQKNETEKLSMINGIFIYIAYLVTLFVLVTTTLSN